MRTKIYDQASFLLRRYPYRHNSSLLDFFSRDYGVVRLVHHHRRNARTKRKELVQLGQTYSLSWKTGRKDSNLANLIEVHPSPQPLERTTSSTTILLSLSYMNELVISFCQPHDAHPDLFDNYYLVSCELHRGADEFLLRYFEFQLLKTTGYGFGHSQDILPEGLATPTRISAEKISRWIDIFLNNYALDSRITDIPAQELSAIDRRPFEQARRQFTNFNPQEKQSLRHWVRERITTHVKPEKMRSTQIAQDLRTLRRQYQNRRGYKGSQLSIAPTPPWPHYIYTTQPRVNAENSSASSRTRLASMSVALPSMTIATSVTRGACWPLIHSCVC